MAFVQVIEGTATLASVSNTTVLVASNNRANSIVVFSARINGGGDNAWDTQISCTRPDDTHLTFRRAGNQGTVTIRFFIFEDTDLSVEDVTSTALGSGDNLLSFGDVGSLSDAFINPLGFAVQGERAEDTGCRLTFVSTTQLNARLEGAPGGEELSVQVVQWSGASVQEITQQSSADASVLISTVAMQRTIVLATSTSTADPWQNNQQDTVELADATHVEFERFAQTGATNRRAAHVVQLPPNMSVQRGRKEHASGTATDTFSIASVDLTKSVPRVCGAYNAPYTQSDNESGRSMNRTCWEIRFSLATEITMQRSTTVNAAKLSFELFESGNMPTPPDVALWLHW